MCIYIEREVGGDEDFQAGYDVCVYPQHLGSRKGKV